MAVRVQDHIHLSLELGDSPENAPDTKWYVKADGWKPTPVIFMSLTRTLGGKLIKHRLRDGNGDIIRLKDWQYIIRVSDYGELTKEDRQTLLESMNGEVVKVVHHYHPDNGENHTTYVKDMVLQITDIENLDANLQVLYVAVRLTDASAIP